MDYFFTKKVVERACQVWQYRYLVSRRKKRKEKKTALLNVYSCLLLFSFSKQKKILKGSPKLPVLATDGNEEVINLAKINIERNFNDNNEKERVKAIQMQWGFVESMDLDGMADIIIGSDLTYNPNTWRSLCESIDVILVSTYLQ